MINKNDLDHIDLNILRLLQDNGRMTNVELAKHVGISPPPCLRRLKTLEDANVITRYQAHINPEFFNFNVTIMAEVTLKSQNDSDLREFEAKTLKWPYVRDVYLITGTADFMLRIVVPDFQVYQNFMGTELSTVSNVQSIKTHIVLRNVKSEYGLPFDVIENSYKELASKNAEAEARMKDLPHNVEETYSENVL